MSTLYLTIQTHSVRLENHALIINSEDASGQLRTARVLLKDISRVVVSGSPNITIPALKSLCKAKIPLALVSTRGRWIGELSGVVSNNAARRIAQYRWAVSGEAAALHFAIPLVATKIANQRDVLRRLINRYGKGVAYASTLARLKAMRAMLAQAQTVEQVRGIEGLASAEYFRALSGFFPREVPFVERSRRPPRNGANALLSFSYAIVLSEVEFALRYHGLDPAIGFMHSLVPGRAALALDLVEPFRPSADAFVLSLLNRKIFTEADFRFSPEDCGTYLEESSHAKFFEHYEKAMTRPFTFGKNGQHVDLRGVIDRQTCCYLQSLADADCAAEFFRIPQ